MKIQQKEWFVTFCTLPKFNSSPLKINMEHNSLEVWWRSFSLLNGWFVGSMLIFQGVTPEKWWLEDDPFLLERSNFSGAMLLNFVDVRANSPPKIAGYKVQDSSILGTWNFWWIWAAASVCRTLALGQSRKQFITLREIYFHSKLGRVIFCWKPGTQMTLVSNG